MSTKNILNRSSYAAVNGLMTSGATNNQPYVAGFAWTVLKSLPTDPKWAVMNAQYVNAVQNTVITVPSNRFAQNAAVNSMTQQIKAAGVSDHGVAKGLAKDLVNNGNHDAQNELFNALLREGKDVEQATRETFELSANAQQAIKASIDNVAQAKQLQHRQQPGQGLTAKPKRTVSNEKTSEPTMIPGGPSTPRPSGPGCC